MKILFRVLLLLFIASLSLSIQAQTYGFKTGLVLGKSDLGEMEGSAYELKMSPGFHGGLVLEFPISKSLAIESGISFTTKGVRIFYEEEDNGLDYSYKFYNLEIPARLKVSVLSTQNSKLYLGFGTYLGLARDGKLEGTETYSGQEYSGEMYFEIGNDDDEDSFKSLETGLSVGIELQNGSLQYGIKYDIGLTDIAHYPQVGDAMKHRALTISIGYVFGSFKKSAE